ncbi:MAG: iron uptake system protein EfeO, partial [Pseudonocardiaceae bacterium]
TTTHASHTFSGLEPPKELPMVIILRSLTVATAVIFAAVACGSPPSKNGSIPERVTVKAGDKTCAASTTSFSSGRRTFSIENTSRQVSGFYLYGAGDQIISEVGNINPSTTLDLTVDLSAGKYQVACRPGMAGSGIRTALTVGGPVVAEVVDSRLRTGVASYRSYVEKEAQELTGTTAAFTAAIKVGKIDQAKALYPAARTHYERIEPIAGSFEDLDPLIDMRIDNITAATPFVGFHKLEQDLWERQDISASGPAADALLANVKKLQTETPTLEITPVTMGEGTKELFDEIAKSKVTGEEERYSRTDLIAFAANVEGARSAYTALRPVLVERDPTLVSTLDERFGALLGLLNSHRSQQGGPGYIAGSPFVSYDSLTATDLKALSDEVTNISEPLGQLTAEVMDK